jgi:Flp pilus assembly protein TadD
MRVRVPLLVSAALGLALSTAAPAAQAFPFGRPKAAPAQASPQAAPAQSAAQPAGRGAPRGRAAETPAQPGPAAAPAAPAPKPATAAERQAARGLDLVGQSNFWINELAKNSAELEAAVEASVALRRIGSHERAAEVAAVGLQAHGEDARLWAALGHGLVGAKQAGPAVQALQKAIALSPRDPALRSALGVAYDMLDMPEFARAAYGEGLRLAPDDAALLTNQGLSLALAGDMTGAEAMLRRAVARPGAPAQARQNLALVVGLQGRFDESQRLATADLPAEVAAENVAYLRRMLNGGDSRWTRAGSESN